MTQQHNNSCEKMVPLSVIMESIQRALDRHDCTDRNISKDALSAHDIAIYEIRMLREDMMRSLRCKRALGKSTVRAG
mgnify:CR=1 FL=1